MGIQNWSEDIILVNLAREPQMGEELQTVIQIVSESQAKNVVLDFSDIDIVTSSSIAKMLKLRKILVGCDRRLIFCSLSDQTMKLFKITALDSIFEFMDDQFVALAAAQMAPAE